MADRAVAVTPAFGAALAAALIAAMTLGTAGVVALHAGATLPGPADWAAVRFTLLQAALSALLSGALAVPVARALARRRFRGRRFLITLTGAPFLLPVIVAVLGLLAVFGRAGIVNDGLAQIGLPRMSIYGLHGVVLAHVFLNLPLVTRMLLMGWQAIPAERFRLAQSLGMTAGAEFRHLEWPMLRATLPGAVLTVFTICLASFAVALTLGGGPRATTVELAIYQALRFDFAPDRAATLAAMQFTLCLGALVLGWLMMRDAGFGAGLGRRIEMSAPRGWRLWQDAVAILLAAGFLIVPLGLLVARGIAGMDDLPDGIGQAILRSVLVALASMILTMAAALVLALAAARRAPGHRLFDMTATLPLAASSLVVGTGLFLALRGVASPSAMALPITVAVNATLALPYVYRLLLPEARSLHLGQARLAEALGMTGMARLRWVVLPGLARPLGFGAGIAAALSMGDLGVITLFAAEGTATLPLFIHGLMGSYQMEAAAAASLILMGLSFGLFAACDGIGRYVAT